MEALHHHADLQAHCPAWTVRWLPFVDLDRLKQVNDQFGHAAGDELLRYFAAELGANPARTNTIARFGGDEFAVLLEGLECPADAECVAERVLQAARGCPLPSGILTQPSVNVGFSIARNAALTAKLLISQADAAMCRATHSGGGRFELFDGVAHS